MSNMHVYRMTNEAFGTLVNVAKDNPDLWLNPATDFVKVLADHGVTHYQESTNVVAQGTISLEEPKEGRPSWSDQQALHFHTQFLGMTAARASDPNLLAWLNHFVLHAYGIARWPRQKHSNPTNHVTRHWLTEKPQDIWESSVSGRTWWLAETCLRAELASQGAVTAQQALALFTESPERYHQCMQFSFLRNPQLTVEYIRALLHEARAINSKGLIHWVRQINRQAGALLIDALSLEQRRGLVVKAATQAMTDEKHVTVRKYLEDI